MFAAGSDLRGGLALCSGGATVTLGMELGGVCAAAVPLRPHNNEIDMIVKAEGTTRLDEILMTGSPKSDQGVAATPCRRRRAIQTASLTIPIGL